MRKKWTVYILECADGTLYTGITTDIERRFEEHKRGLGGRYTASRGVKRVVYREKAGARGVALKKEIEVKKLTRLGKLKLIKSRYGE